MIDRYLKTFSITVNDHLILFNWSITYAAIKFGFSSSLLYKILDKSNRYNPTLKTVVKIANEFGVSIDALIGREPPPINIRKIKKRVTVSDGQMSLFPAHTKPSTED